MFEKEIKYIIDFTLNRIKKLGSFFTYEKLASIELHPAIILYISAELDYLIYEDRKKLLQNSSFDYSGSEISKYFRLIGEEIKKSKRLAFEDIKILVTDAVTFNMNYLVSPNRTVSQLIFNEDKNRNVNEIKMMLNYLYYYDYVKNVFQGYFSKRKILSLSETEFDMILEKIDRQMFSERTRDLIDNALVSIADFFNEGGVNKTEITAQSVEAFLKEKNLMESLFKLRRSIPADDKHKYDIDDIRRILYTKEPVRLEPEDKKREDDKQEVEKKEDKKKEIPQKPLADKKEKVEVKEEEEPDEETDENEIIEEEIVIEDIEPPQKPKPPEKPEPPEKSEPPEPADKGKEFWSVPEVNLEKEISSEEKEHKITESEDKDDFLSRYETELKSLEDLEAQLRHLGVEENLSPDEPFEEMDIEETEQKGGQAEEEPPETEDNVEEQTESSYHFGEDDGTDLSDDLVFEEEEVNTDEKEKEDSSEEKTAPTPAPPPVKAKDILSFLSDKEMDKIVSNVFNEDEEDFANTMEKISESPGYDEATEILKTVFSSYKISPFSRDAVTLTNAVSNYFDQD